VWGTDDPFGGAGVARSFVARIPGATLALVPGGHAVWIDDAEGAAAAAVAWLG
jgi:pimeloyl-ACP methyl ester carboxylesterase